MCMLRSKVLNLLSLLIVASIIGLVVDLVVVAQVMAPRAPRQPTSGSKKESFKRTFAFRDIP